ncbi:MAG: biotin-dependent carboxyltransferase family protein [Pseudomonadota bacterium]|jgi:biotin-dependent carboxylase-like uncharacterized protein
MSGLRVEHPGIFTLAQNAGRRGLQHTGLTQGGPLDITAWAWANRLLDNPWGATTLEIALGGLRLRAETNTWAAITGADLDARLNDDPVPPWSSFRLRQGDQLSFAHARPGRGRIAILAVAGGFTLPAPCVPREGLGGTQDDGKPLRAGELLPCPRTTHGQKRLVPTPFRPTLIPTPTLRFLPGYQWEHFPADTQEGLFSQSWQISLQGDRMGVRLQGPALSAPPAGPSEALALGAMQIPPDGQPIVLLNDRQTLGGYPKPGCVFALDLAALAQHAPHTALRFMPIDRRTAQKRLAEFLEFFRAP